MEKRGKFKVMDGTDKPYMIQYEEFIPPRHEYQSLFVLRTGQPGPLRTILIAPEEALQVAEALLEFVTTVKERL